MKGCSNGLSPSNIRGNHTHSLVLGFSVANCMSTPTAAPTSDSQDSSTLGIWLGIIIGASILGIFFLLLRHSSVWIHTHKCFTNRKQYLDPLWSPSLWQSICLIVLEPYRRRRARLSKKAIDPTWTDAAIEVTHFLRHDPAISR